MQVIDTHEIEQVSGGWTGFHDPVIDAWIWDKGGITPRPYPKVLVE